MNTEQRCKSCKHFDPEGASMGFGLCKKMPMFWDSTEWDRKSGERVLLPEYANQKAFVQDGSDYHAELVVHPSFGCVMHEKNDGSV